MTTATIPEFINRWSKSGGAERANYALYLSEHCDFIDRDGFQSFGGIDLYKRGFVVLQTRNCHSR